MSEVNAAQQSLAPPRPVRQTFTPVRVRAVQMPRQARPIDLTEPEDVPLPAPVEDELTRARRVVRLSEARAQYTQVKATHRAVVEQWRGVRATLEALEREHLDAVGRRGDLTECLLEVLAADASGLGTEAGNVIQDYLKATVAGDLVTSWAESSDAVPGHTVALPELDELGPNVVAGAGAGLLEVLDRFSVVFNLPDVVDLPVFDFGHSRTLQVTRSTGYAVLTTWDDYRQDFRQLAEGPLEQVLTCED